MLWGRDDPEKEWQFIQYVAHTEGGYTTNLQGSSFRYICATIAITPSK